MVTMIRQEKVRIQCMSFPARMDRKFRHTYEITNVKKPIMKRNRNPNSNVHQKRMGALAHGLIDKVSRSNISFKDQRPFHTSNNMLILPHARPPFPYFLECKEEVTIYSSSSDTSLRNLK